MRRRRGRKRATGAERRSVAGPAERPLVDRLHPRSDRLRPALSDPEHYRRRHQGVPGGACRYVDLGQEGRSRAHGSAGPPRQPGDDRLRSRHRVHLERHARLDGENQVAWHFIAPGKPMQNGICESFNGRMRDELLNETLFFGLGHARTAIASWVADYNNAGRTRLCATRPRRLCRHPHRNGRPAEQPRPAPPSARCSVGATAPISAWNSGLRWMKERGQVTVPSELRPPAPGLTDLIIQWESRGPVRRCIWPSMSETGSSS